MPSVSRAAESPSGADRIARQTLTFGFCACLATKPVPTFVGHALGSGDLRRGGRAGDADLVVVDDGGAADQHHGAGVATAGIVTVQPDGDQWCQQVGCS